MQGNFGEHLWWHGVCSTAFLPPLWQQNVVCEEGRHALVTHGGVTGIGHKSCCIEGLLTTATPLMIRLKRPSSWLYCDRLGLCAVFSQAFENLLVQKLRVKK